MANNSRIRNGRRTLKSYCDALKLPQIERRQHYTITDCIADLLHYARSCGFDPYAIIDSAQGHYASEVKEPHP